jgi:hypothetical protein
VLRSYSSYKKGFIHYLTQHPSLSSESRCYNSGLDLHMNLQYEGFSPPDSSSSGGHDTTLTKPREVLATLRSILVKLVRSAHCGIWVGSILRWTYHMTMLVRIHNTVQNSPAGDLSTPICNRPSEQTITYLWVRVRRGVRSVHTGL